MNISIATTSPMATPCASEAKIDTPATRHITA
jgi:hypothetical protein